MTPPHLKEISDRDLLDAMQRVAANERNATVELLALLGEVDARKLYLGEGCASLFTYCTEVLRLSEHAAYHRIEGARVARHFPCVLGMLSSGALTLTTVALLRPILTPDNAEQVLGAAAFKSKRAVELLVACYAPKPDAQTMVRRIPNAAAQPLRFIAPMLADAPPAAAAAIEQPPGVLPTAALGSQRLPRPMSAPLTSDRFLLRLTISAETHAKLRRAQDLLRHSIPTGDPAAVLERALTMLVEHLERGKAGKAKRPRLASVTVTPAKDTRHIPRPVKRAVWKRDDGRCTFEGSQGRCTETAWLEFHHIVAFARGGPTDVANLTLRCRAHNQFEGQREFGPRPERPREKAIALPL